MSDIDAAEQRAPGRFWYWVAAILFFGSITLPTPIALWHLFSDNNLVVRLITPEIRTLQFSRGQHTIFYHSMAVVDGEIISGSGFLTGLRVTVRGKNGVSVPVEASRVSSRYNYSGQIGRAILEFQIPEAGEYTISGEHRGPAKDQRTILMVRKEFYGGLFGTIMFAVGASLIGAFLGVYIFLRTLWRRTPLFKLKRKLQFVKVNPGLQQAQTPPNPSQHKPAPKYTPPGSEQSSPVEHTYDRDK